LIKDITHLFHFGFSTSFTTFAFIIFTLVSSS
jgi:hypothetical protein